MSVAFRGGGGGGGGSVTMSVGCWVQVCDRSTTARQSTCLLNLSPSYIGAVCLSSMATCSWRNVRSVEGKILCYTLLFVPCCICDRETKVLPSVVLVN